MATEIEYPWRASSQPCPVCAGPVKKRDDSDEGRVYESEEVCTACGLYEWEYSYGNTRTKYGWVNVESYYNGSGDDFLKESSIRQKALEEIKQAYAHPDFAAIREHAPLLAQAGWLEDHGFPIQSAAIMATINQETQS